MGVKVPIGYYKYNQERPKWAITIGGVLQGLSFFFGFCAIMSALLWFIEPVFRSLCVFSIFLFSGLTVLCQLVGRRLAIGKKKMPKKIAAKAASAEGAASSEEFNRALIIALVISATIFLTALVLVIVKVGGSD